jgi:hypothetical protein
MMQSVLQNGKHPVLSLARARDVPNPHDDNQIDCHSRWRTYVCRTVYFPQQ